MEVVVIVMCAIKHRKIHSLHHNCHDLWLKHCLFERERSRATIRHSTADSPVVKLERSRLLIMVYAIISEIRSFRSCQSVRQHTYERTNPLALEVCPSLAQFAFVCWRTDRRSRDLYSHHSHFQAIALTTGDQANDPSSLCVCASPETARETA